MGTGTAGCRLSTELCPAGCHVPVRTKGIQTRSPGKAKQVKGELARAGEGGESVQGQEGAAAAARERVSARFSSQVWEDSEPHLLRVT